LAQAISAEIACPRCASEQLETTKGHPGLV